MNNLKTLADRLAYIMDKQNLKQEQLAKDTGVAQQTISKLLKGKIKNPECIEDLSYALNCSAGWLRFGEKSNVGQIEYVDQRIPVLSWEDIGNPCNDIINLIHKETEMLPNIFNTGRNSYALTIQDDSMNPNPGVTNSFMEGDKIVIEPDMKHKSGDFVIARLKTSNEAFFKQYFYEDGKHYLASLNPKLNRSMEVNEDIEIVGVYVGMVRKHKK